MRSSLISTVCVAILAAFVVGVNVPAATALDILLPGEKIVVKNDKPAPDEDPTRRKVRWVARGGNVVSPARGNADDPRCLVSGGGGAGGTIRFLSDGSGGSTQDTGEIPLPCANWEAIGSPSNSRGYRYRDRDQDEGPCKGVEVRKGKWVRARCTGKVSPLGYDLTVGTDEGVVGTVLSVGAAGPLLHGVRRHERQGW